MKIKIDDADLRLINQVYASKVLTERDILLMSVDELWELTILLGGLIGYDKETGDIDSLGKIADDVISKVLLIMYDKQEKEHIVD